MSPPTTTTASMDTTTSESNAAGTVNDDVLREAEEQLRPLIKEELRHTIQCKRVAKGLPSHVDIEYKTPRLEVRSLLSLYSNRTHINCDMFIPARNSCHGT